MADAQMLDAEDNPLWLLELPDTDNIRPPVDTLKQELPFGELTWKNFERLCLKLAGTDGDAEYYRLYGTEGQDQGGNRHLRAPPVNDEVRCLAKQATQIVRPK